MRTPCLTAASKAPAFSIKLRSLHVSPLSQKMTGIGEPLPALGSMTENFIVQPSTALACSYLPGADARSGFRGEGWSDAKSVLCACYGVVCLLRTATAFCRHTHWFTLAPNAFLLSFTAAILWILCSLTNSGNGGSALHHAASCRKARRQRYITLHHATSRSVTSRNHAERHAGTHKRVRPHADACAALFVGARCSIRWRTTSGAPLLARHLAPPTLNPEP
jgi:hypothetical protein